MTGSFQGPRCWLTPALGGVGPRLWQGVEPEIWAGRFLSCLRHVPSQIPFRFAQGWVIWVPPIAFQVTRLGTEGVCPVALRRPWRGLCASPRLAVNWPSEAGLTWFPGILPLRLKKLSQPPAQWSPGWVGAPPPPQDGRPGYKATYSRGGGYMASWRR